MSEEKPATEIEQPIVIKKVVKGGGGHHGGAWKVAYADFVTAMMAFFLLLWLLNVTTSDQKDAISNYFDPSHPMIANKDSGAGGVLGGLSVAKEGAMVTNVQKLTNPEPTGKQAETRPEKRKPPTKIRHNEQSKAEQRQKLMQQVKNDMREIEQQQFEKVQERILATLRRNPDLANLTSHLQMDNTDEGLRIQIIDKDGSPLFPSGSARMFSKTKALMAQVGQVINETDNQLSIRGHTDGVPYGPGAEYTNWELSSDRANASRRALIESGVVKDRIQNVMGRADTELYVPDDPADPQNRRISIILLKTELTNPEKFTDDAIDELIETIPAYKEAMEAIDNETAESLTDPLENVNLPPPAPLPDDVFRQTPGRIQFP